MECDAARRPIVQAVARLPPEAFQFVCGMLYNTSRTAGGFEPASREALEQLRPLIETYLGMNKP